MAHAHDTRWRRGSIVPAWKDGHTPRKPNPRAPSGPPANTLQTQPSRPPCLVGWSCSRVIGVRAAHHAALPGDGAGGYGVRGGYRTVKQKGCVSPATFLPAGLLFRHLRGVCGVREVHSESNSSVDKPGGELLSFSESNLCLDLSRSEFLSIPASNSRLGMVRALLPSPSARKCPVAAPADE